MRTFFGVLVFGVFAILYQRSVFGDVSHLTPNSAGMNILKSFCSIGLCSIGCCEVSLFYIMSITQVISAGACP